MTVNYFETINILLFNNTFMRGSVIILTAILSPNFSDFGFKLEAGIHGTIYYLSLATFRGE